MIETFSSILTEIMRLLEIDPGPIIHSAGSVHNDYAMARSLNTAFLSQLAGRSHPSYKKGKEILQAGSKEGPLKPVAAFYLKILPRIHAEIGRECTPGSEFDSRMIQLKDTLKTQDHGAKGIEEAIWGVFFPEARDIRGHRQKAIAALRNTRRIEITALNENPIKDPAAEILFTANALLGLPGDKTPVEDLDLSDEIKDALHRIKDEPQAYWYDHPVEIGVAQKNNEIIYGLKGLDDAMQADPEQRGNRISCVLSLSTTHKGLHRIAGRYIREELERAGRLKAVDAFVFTEEDTQAIIDECLVPAAGHYLGIPDAASDLDMFGVDGKYGRHYSFLKAISAFWRVFIDPRKKATFKIDLDQVFIQKTIIKETGTSALGHFKTPLWGARGKDSMGNTVQLGMIAGALVNCKDMEFSLFTPDITFPDQDLKPDEYIFYSRLPQALSTQAEMMTRYTPKGPDGKDSCIERIHVTGGTNGILIDDLVRYRPFTPSFIGRAEDQAYILSVLDQTGPRLAYVHEPGLIMRHDKEALVPKTIAAASTSKLIGDYIRILMFSAYASMLETGIDKIKGLLDPFTGCFITKLPLSVVALRMALRADALFASDQGTDAMDLLINASKRITQTIDLVSGLPSQIEKIYKKERAGWDLYYEILRHIENALDQEDPFAIELRKKAQDIVSHTRG
ncbi:MAG: hypothetical protein U9P80_00330 [Thermodesulfobacteriota bacterium]|nr:hypothetical protein [Thermodesulfobacteriota bacterium]